MDVLIQIAHISYGSAFIPLLIALFQWKRLTKALKIIVWISILSILSDSVSIYLILQKISFNNWITSNIFLILQATLFILFMMGLLRARYQWLFISLILVISLINFFFIQTPLVFNSYINYFIAILLIILCLVYLYRLLKELPALDIYRFPPLWIVFAILTYYGGTLFLFLFNNYFLSTNIITHRSIWILHNVLNILKNLLLALALWQNYRKARLSR